MLLILSSNKFNQFPPVLLNRIMEFYRSANWLALLFVLVLLVETEPAENISFVMQPADKKI